MSNLRSARNYDRDEVSRFNGLRFELPSRTQQQFKAEADINNLVKRYGLTGVMPGNPKVPMYGDFTEVKDYQTAMQAVVEARDGFMALPAEVRRYFDNDPQALMVFMADEKNREKADELGLLKKKPEKDRAGVEVAPVVAAAVPAEKK